MDLNGHSKQQELILVQIRHIPRDQLINVWLAARSDYNIKACKITKEVSGT